MGCPSKNMPSPKKKSPKKSKERVQIDNQKSSQMITNVYKELLTLISDNAKRIAHLEAEVLTLQRLQKIKQETDGMRDWGEDWPRIREALQIPHPLDDYPGL